MIRYPCSTLKLISMCPLLLEVPLVIPVIWRYNGYVLQAHASLAEGSLLQRYSNIYNIYMVYMLFVYHVRFV